MSTFNPTAGASTASDGSVEYKRSQGPPGIIQTSRPWSEQPQYLTDQSRALGDNLIVASLPKESTFSLSTPYGRAGVIYTSLLPGRGAEHFAKGPCTIVTGFYRPPVATTLDLTEYYTILNWNSVWMSNFEACIIKTYGTAEERTSVMMHDNATAFTRAGNIPARGSYTQNAIYLNGATGSATLKIDGVVGINIAPQGVFPWDVGNGRSILAGAASLSIYATYLLAFKSYLSDQALAEVRQNPWQFFQPRSLLPPLSTRRIPDLSSISVDKTAHTASPIITGVF